MIAERIGWPHSAGPLEKRLAKIRPEYVGVDPVSRTAYQPGELAQCDLSEDNRAIVGPWTPRPSFQG